MWFIIGVSPCAYGGWEIPWPSICQLETLASQWCNSGPSPKAWEPRAPGSHAGEGRPSSSSENRLALPLPLCSIQALNGLDDARWHWRGWSALLGLLIQRLIFSRTIFRDIPRSNVLPAIWASLSPVELTHDITIKGSFLKIATYHSYFYLLQTEKTGAKKKGKCRLLFPTVIHLHS